MQFKLLTQQHLCSSQPTRTLFKVSIVSNNLYHKTFSENRKELNCQKKASNISATFPSIKKFMNFILRAATAAIQVSHRRSHHAMFLIQ